MVRDGRSRNRQAGDRRQATDGDSEVVVRIQAEAAPGFGDDDAVAGVVGIVADLDGKIDADVADQLGE
jgi:hypothetical protein